MQHVPRLGYCPVTTVTSRFVPGTMLPFRDGAAIASRTTEEVMFIQRPPPAE